MASLERREIPIGWKDAKTFQTTSQPTPFKGLYGAGAIASLFVAGCHLRTRLNGQVLIDLESLPEDTAETLGVLAKHGVAIASELLRDGISFTMATGTSGAKTLYLLTAPTPVKNWVDDLVQNQSWFPQFLRGHARVTGETGAGKTFLVLKLLTDWVENNPSTSLTICDLNYGKPNPRTGRLNDWLGIDPGYVHSQVNRIVSAVSSEFEELERRRSLCDAETRQAIEEGRIPKLSKPFPPRLVLIDELDGLFEEIDEKSDFHSHLRALLKQGRGYNFKVVLCGQSMAVAASGIKLATAKQLNSLRVIKGKIDRDELKYFANCDYNELTEKVAQLQKKGYRVAIAQLGEASPQVVIIPDLSEVESYRFAKVDRDEIWWHSIWTKETQLWLKGLAERHARGEITSPLKTDIAERFGVKIRSDDARYSNYVKPQWEALLKQAKEIMTHERP
ncbi:MAG: ATP-binding protein [Actinomycetota bacterium]